MYCSFEIIIFNILICLHFLLHTASSLNGAEGGAQCIGLGCNGKKIDEIVSELKNRQKFRGDRAKVRMAEQTLTDIAELSSKVNEIRCLFYIYRNFVLMIHVCNLPGEYRLI